MYSYWGGGGYLLEGSWDSVTKALNKGLGFRVFLNKEAIFMGTDSLNSVPITLLTKSHGPPSMRCSGFRGINAIPSLGGFMCGYIRILVQGKWFIYLQGYLYSNNTSRSRRELRLNQVEGSGFTWTRKNRPFQRCM